MNQKSNSLQLTREQSKNEWRYMLVLLILGTVLGIFIHNSATKPVLVSDQHAANQARDVTPKELSTENSVGADSATTATATASK